MVTASINPEGVIVIKSLITLVSKISDVLPLFIIQKDGIYMSTINDLKAASDALVLNEQALATEVGQLVTSVDGLIAAFDAIKASGGLSAADQDTLDTAVAMVVDASTDLANQTASIDTEQNKADAR